MRKKITAILLSLCIGMSGFAGTAFAEQPSDVTTENRVSTESENTEQEAAPDSAPGQTVTDQDTERSGASAADAASIGDAADESADDSKGSVSTESVSADTVSDDSASDAGTESESAPVRVARAAAVKTTPAFSVTNARIKETVDGTAPFDSDNNAGDDAAADNGIVRSFDTITYSIEYVTAITSNIPVDDGKVYVRFTLPCTSDVAQFNMDAMKWLQDAKQTTTEDGSQVITGYRYLTNSEEGVAIPGAGTLSCGIQVRAAKNGTVIQPSFELWAENDEDNEKSITADSVTVSAAPSYDFSVVYNTGSEGCDFLTWANPDTGMLYDEENKAQAGDNVVSGRLQGMGIGFMMHQQNASKGMKGLEYPSGDITFDVKLSAIVNGKDMSYDKNYQPYFWDYCANNGYSGKGDDKGNLGRQMYFVQGTSGGLNWKAPRNKWSSSSAYGGEGDCWDGGNYSVQQDMSDPNLYHFTIKDYQFDYENYHFPTTPNYHYISLDSSDYWISCGYMQTIARFPESVDQTSNYILQQKLENISVSSKSGQTDGINVRTDNDLWSYNIVLYPTGSRYNGTWYWEKYALVGTNHPGTNYASRNEDQRICSYYGQEYEKAGIACNILQKFDSSGMTPSDTPRGDYTSRIFYAAKPDGTPWESDEEMEKYHEENMVYYDSYDALVKSGKTCVGVLYEIRNFNIKYSWVGGYTPVKINSDAVIGKVYKTVSDVRAWYQGETPARSWETTKHDDGSYGLGASTTEYSGNKYTSDYSTPGWQRYHTGYTKTQYRDGVMVGGHAGGYLNGNSILIVSDHATIDITNNDGKTSYDMDKYERTASFKLTPALSMIGSSGATASGTDNLTITVTLPKLLYYNQNSLKQGNTQITPESVTENSDGTTTLKIRLLNQNIGKTIEPLTFSTRIGNVGTLNDVTNNQQLKLNTQITSDMGGLAVAEMNHNISSTSIAIIKLAAIAVYKSTDTPLIDLHDTFRFTLTFGNNSQNEADNGVLYDVLPYNGDSLGSKFGGYYDLKAMEADYGSAPLALTSQKTAGTIAWYTTNTDVRGMDYAGLSAVTDWKPLTARISGNTIRISGFPDSGQNVTAIRFASMLGGGESIRITFTCLDKNQGSSSQKVGDTYINRFFENSDNQVAPVISNAVKVQVVDRRISGNVWLDNDHNNIRGADDNFLSGITAALYQMDVSGNYVKAKDVYGNSVPDITTGTDGAYEFGNLAKGTYRIVLTNMEKYLSQVEKHVGTDTTVDSDADGVVKADGYGELEKSEISGIELPDKSLMADQTYRSEHNDSGLYINESLLPALATSLRDTEGTQYTEAKKNAVLNDTVDIKRLNAFIGKTITVTGTLYDKESGQPLTVGGKTITASKTLKINKEADQVTNTFTFDASGLKGKTVVAAESITFDGKEIASHNDMNDAEQMVFFPNISTILYQDANGDKAASDGEKIVTFNLDENGKPVQAGDDTKSFDTNVTLTDQLAYQNLAPSTVYLITGKLKKVNADGTLSDTGIKAEETSFRTPSAADGDLTVSGTTDIHYDVDTMAKKDGVYLYHNCQLVAFESLNITGKSVSAREEENVEAQRIRIAVSTSKKTASKGNVNRYEIHTWSITTKIPSGMEDSKPEQRGVSFTDPIDSRLDYKGNVRIDVLDSKEEKVLLTLDDGDYTVSGVTEGTAGGTLKADLTASGLEKISKKQYEGESYLRLRFDTLINKAADITPEEGVAIPNKAEIRWDSLGKVFLVHATANVTSGTIRIRKTDSSHQPLAGAKFVLLNKDGSRYQQNNGVGTHLKDYQEQRSGEDGYAEWTGLADGTYYIRETTAPDGKELQTDDIMVKLENHKVVSVNDTAVVNPVFSIGDNGQLALQTGGPGRVMILIVSLSVIAIAVFSLLVALKEQKKFEKRKNDRQ